MKKTIFAVLLAATVLLIGCDRGANPQGDSIIGKNEITDSITITEDQREEFGTLSDDIISNSTESPATESTEHPSEDITVPPEVSESETTAPSHAETLPQPPETAEQPDETLPEELPDDTGSLPAPTVRNLILTKKTLNADGTAKLTVSVEGDVNFYGLEFKMNFSSKPETVDITLHAEGAAANYTPERGLVFSFVSPTASNVTQSITLFSVTLPSADAETEIFGIDIFDDKFVNEKYTVY